MDWFRMNTPNHYEYQAGMARADRLMVPAISDRSYRIDAHLELPDEGATGVVLACGNRFGGFVLYCADGQIVFEYIYTEARTYKLSAPIAPGLQQVTVQFVRLGKNAGRFSLQCGGREMDFADVPKTWTTYGITAGLTCGYANVPIAEAIVVPAIFTGVIQRVTVDLVEEGATALPHFKAILQEE